VTTGIGIVGCGNICEAYLSNLPRFPGLRLAGVADLDPGRAAAMAGRFDLAPFEVAALLASDAVDIVLNLTTPAAHVELGLAALAAGKHVYAEKPLATDLSGGRRLLQAAEEAGLAVASAPDTFLGGAHQQVRACLDGGGIGAPLGGTAFMLCPGHEGWHPGPAFYYARGGGPLFDMGPYYLTQLVNLLGPVAEIAGLSVRPRATRVVGSGPDAGREIPVEVDTHVTATLAFANGALVQMAMSFDVAATGHAPFEIYGTAGTLEAPDPNRFGGPIRVNDGEGWRRIPVTRPFAEGNHRGLGLAEMARALERGTEPRASGGLALHILEVMELVGRAASERRVLPTTTAPPRPPAFDDPAGLASPTAAREEGG